jgi:hypothetical protein
VIARLALAAALAVALRLDAAAQPASPRDDAGAAPRAGSDASAGAAHTAPAAPSDPELGAASEPELGDAAVPPAEQARQRAAPAAPPQAPRSPAAAAAALTSDDLAMARIAWRYFERNYQPATGFVNATDGYPSTTLWDLGSSLFGTVAARELGLLSREAFDGRVSAMLRTLATQPLFEGELPNKAYDAATGKMADYGNRPAPRGIGSSGVDLGRMASALALVAEMHPSHRGEVAAVLRRWKWCRAVRGGELQGAFIEGSGAVKDVQEGRLGYEQYAAHGLALLGLDVSRAARYDRFAADADILGVPVRHDARDPRKYGAIDAVVTDPWVLDAFEHGLGGESERIANSLFEVQKRRWRGTGVVTAAGEDHVDRPPWFVYGSVWADGRAWRTITTTGEDASALQGLSTKAAFALATLYPGDPYASVLRDAMSNAYDPERGWFAGLYERGGVNRSVNANTNGVLLEALLYKARGRPLHAAADAARDGGPLRAAVREGAGASCPADGVQTAAAEGGTGSARDAGGGSGAGAVGGSHLELSTPPLAPGPGASASRPRSLFRLDGTLFTGYRGADRFTAGGVVTVWPWDFTFLRIGGEATPMSKFGSSRLLWGAGYDDWHDNTIFLHVDNWGPIRATAESFATSNSTRHALLDQAEVNFGWRLPRLCAARAVCFSPLASVTAPFVGGPYLNARVTLTLFDDWFLMGGIGWNIPGLPSDLRAPAGTPPWRVVYGLGRASWKPGSLFVTYFDWGPNYRYGNGILAVGVNWAF